MILLSRIYCLIVTYGDRSLFLLKVLDAAVKEGIKNFILIDNGMSIKSRTELDIYLQNSEIAVKIIRFPTNTGSASAFSTGIQDFFHRNIDFIWILDDDNMPEKGSLTYLIDFWEKYNMQEKNQKLMLSSIRYEYQFYYEPLLKKNPDLILPAKNSFCGFHIKNLVKLISSRIKEKVIPNKAIIINNGKINASAYGGLFFHRDVLKKIGFPKKIFFMYMDDLDFTYSHTQLGGEIWLIVNSKIKDIERSFYLPKKKKFFYHSSLDGENSSLVYYSIRNLVFFSLSKRVNSFYIYYLNKILFIFSITIMAIFRRKIKRLFLIYEAIKNGTNGNLGFNDKYKL